MADIYEYCNNRRFSRAVESDLQYQIPIAVFWNCEDVSKWISEIGFPQYCDCFRTNFVDGRKLIAINSSTLPRMGVQDFEDIKKITEAIRNLLRIPKVSRRESAMSDPRYAYIEARQRSGKITENLTYQNFIRENRIFFPDAIKNNAMSS